MIKFVIEKFRSAPGPLKQPRLILADIAEEVLDTARQYLDQRSGSGRDGEPRGDVEDGFRAAESVARDDSGSESAADFVPGAAPSAGLATPPSRILDVDARLTQAISDSGNIRKQDFKVLAILWDAYHRGLVPLSAKAVSDHGVQVGLAIRHENVRKVIRMRLEKYVDYHNEGAGSATIYRYALNAVGRAHFEETYLRESER